MTDTGETYLGDGLYAGFDGFQITLRAPRPEGDHWVALEAPVFSALLDFHKRIVEKAQVSDGRTEPPL